MISIELCQLTNTSAMHIRRPHTYNYATVVNKRLMGINAVANSEERFRPLFLLFLALQFGYGFGN
jgi:hypothetical protein